MASCPACKQPLPTIRGLDAEKRDEVAFELGMGERENAASIVSQATGLSPGAARAYVECPHAVPAGPPEAPKPAGDKCPVCGLPLPLQRADEFAALLAAGRKIEAIKLCRELTGVGLAEAKAIIDCPHDPSRVPVHAGSHHGAAPRKRSCVAGCFLIILLVLSAGIVAIFLLAEHRSAQQRELRETELRRASICADCGKTIPPYPGDEDAEWARRTFFDHIRNGRRLEAIKYVRERTGWGLKEAKDYVTCPHVLP